eukprot:maker-scaffold1056_size66302-snap-gene-0.17 protein:Tk00360 transcript:maker-scaffold1056_size66302-snap-gene-0.17-mRNA-1 annotation:"protein szt2-like"
MSGSSEPAPPPIPAKEVYTLLNRSSRVSRNVRAQWYFSLLSREEFEVAKYEGLEECGQNEMDIVGVVPEAVLPVSEWDWDVSHLYRYRLTSLTQVHFLSQRYSAVFMLDMSPSGVAQDSVLAAGALDKMLAILEESLLNLARPFYIPGSQLLFQPDICVTVMAWTPFLTAHTPSVLKQGWLLTSVNVEQLLQEVIQGLAHLEQIISDTNGCVQDDIATIRAESERMMGGLFDHPHQPPLLSPSVHVSSSDSAFVSMIRAAVLGLQLLPTNTTSSIIYIGDAIMSLPDIDKCDSVLNSLRTLSISLSFLRVLARSHADASMTNGPNFDLLKFIALSTYGTFITELPKIKNEDGVYNMNPYHQAFLCWSFRKTLDQLQQHQMEVLRNKYFLTVDNLGVRKILDMDVKSCFTSVLSCRLREGYLMSHVTVSSKENTISVVLTLPWKIASSIHYKLSSHWPLKLTDHETKVELQLEGDYDIIHDIICQRNKHFESGERNSIIRKFYVIVTHLTRVDRLLAHLESFARIKAYFTIPDTIAGGIPLFHIPPNTQKPELYQVDASSGAFVSFWRPICSLDINVWHRWMHTHRINVLMRHDYPWPKHLLSPNSCGRYTIVQSRKAMSQLTSLLKVSSSFTLVDGQSYVKFLFKEEGDKVPFTFYIIRLASSPPCVVLWVAFLGGTSGVLRHKEVESLCQKISDLTITQGYPWKFYHEVEEQRACQLVQKPLDQVLIRYVKAPKNVDCMIDPELFAAAKTRALSPGPAPKKVHSISSMGGFFITLAQYLTHERWVWNIVDTCQRPVICSPGAIARILQLMIKVRLLQGFNFANSKNGVQNLVKEIRAQDSQEALHPFLIQYILYPLSSSPSPSVGYSNDEGEDGESIGGDKESCTTVISEVWIEPQNGHVISEGFFGECSYSEIPGTIFESDKEIIGLQATLEHFGVVCQKTTLPGDLIEICHKCHSKTMKGEEGFTSKRIQISTDVVGLARASPKVELRFSTFFQTFYLNSEFEYERSMQCEKSSYANERLLGTFHEELTDLFDFEQTLTLDESRRIEDFLGMCNDLSVQFTRTRSSSVGDKVADKSIPRWKCYVRATGKGQVLVALIPYGHKDVRELLLEENATVTLNANLQISETAMPSVPTDVFASEVQSLSSSLESRKNSLSGINLSRIGSCIDDNDIPPARSESLSRMRKRTQTIDNSDAFSFVRSRKHSSGDRLLKAPQDKRTRTHTFSYVKHQSGGRSERPTPRVGSKETFDTTGNDCDSVHSSPEHITGSLAIPMYCFSCSEKHLLMHLLNNREITPVLKSFDLRWKTPDIESEKEEDEDPPASHSPSSNPNEFNEQGDEFDTMFIKRIEKRFYKAFVGVLYGSLQHNTSVHEEDVQQAIDLCEVESVVEIKLDEFLSSVCSHTLNPDLSKGPNKGSSGKCFDHSLNHGVMRKKFSDILQKSFRSVPGLSEFYFYRNISRENSKPTPCPGMMGGQHHRQRRNTRDTTSTRDDDLSHHLHMDSDPDQASSKNEQDDQSQITGYGSPRGDDQLSLCSNMVSDLSDSNDCWAHDQILDNPLFFQVTLIAKGGRNLFLNLPINALPSCYLDLSADLEKAIQDAQEASFSEVDCAPNNLALILNITLISCDFREFPDETPMDNPGELPKVVDTSNFAGNHQLNTIQKKAILEMVEDIHWMIADEIAFAKASSTNITEDILTAIVTHVELSVSKPGCATVKSSLDFIMNKEKGMELLKEQISKITIPNFRVITKSKYWYLVRSTRKGIASKLWLIMYIMDDNLHIAFQYREGQLNVVLPWRQALQRLSVKISEALDYVNRAMLLQKLSETRICNRLLDPEAPEDEMWFGAPQYQDAEEDGNNLQANLKLGPGKYACPQVWEKRFLLHPRLIETRGPDVTSRGFVTLKMVMAAFAVHNRKNMYVYQDETGTYYMKLSEHISSSRHSSFVRRSSGGGRSVQPPMGRSMSMSGAEHRAKMASKRLPSPSASDIVELEFPKKNNDFIELRIFGVSKPGSTITKSLVSVLQNKLDEKVVDVLSTILQRNPMSRLMPEDVHFLQPPVAPATTILEFTAPCIRSGYQPVLRQFLVQNLTEVRYIQPKFSSSRKENKLHGVMDSEEVLLRNRTKDGGGSTGQVGIGVIALELERRICGDETSDEDSHTLAELMRIQRIKSETPLVQPDEPRLYFRIHIWESGKMDLEEIALGLHNAIQQAMWDLVLEYILIARPFTEFPNPDNVLVTLVNYWLPLGREMKIPALTERVLPFQTRSNSKQFLQEIYATLRGIFPNGATEVFSKFDEGLEPFQRVTDKMYPTPRCASNPVLFSLTIPKASNVEEYKANPSRSDTLRKFVMSSTSMPRSLHVIVLVHRDEVRIFFYNCAKAVADRVVRHVQFITDWLTGRLRLIEAMASQKLGVLNSLSFFDPNSLSYHHWADLEHLLAHSLPQRSRRPQPVTAHAVSSSNESLSRFFCNQRRGHRGSRMANHTCASLAKVVETLRLDKRHQLLSLWVNRRSEVQFFLTEDILKVVVSLARPIHYCMTPMMFLPRWRMKAHARRFQDDEATVEELESLLETAKFRGHALDEMNNNLIIKHFIKEYRQYLEWMSFVAIPSDSAFEVLTAPVAYFYKILQGGLLLFEIGSNEPFIYTKLYALEHTRIQNFAFKKENWSNAWSSLVMECDRIKFLLHHHSFTYDFHLRAVSDFAMGKINIFRNGYHITSFISNFMKYYNKSPNYARNNIFTQELSIPLHFVQAEQLFNYILSHEKEYGFRVLRMEPLYADLNEEEFSNDFLLTAQSTHQVQVYECDDRSWVDFDLTIILSCVHSSDESERLKLKCVFLFTQKNDYFPILYKEIKSDGLFKPVLGAPPLHDGFPVMRYSPSQGTLDPVGHEKVLYIGYYSHHEQSIMNMVDRESTKLRSKLSMIFQSAEKDCRKDVLWNKMFLNAAKPQHTIEEFEELLGLVEVEAAPNPFAKFPFGSDQLKVSLVDWLERLFPKAFRHLSSNNQEHFLITDENTFNVAAMFSIDYGTPTTDMSVLSLTPSPEVCKLGLKDILGNAISYLLFRETL